MSLVGGDMQKGLALDRLEKAIFAALDRHGSTPPGCSDDVNFERINFQKLESELAGLDRDNRGFLGHENFRVTLMQTEQYLTGIIIFFFFLSHRYIIIFY